MSATMSNHSNKAGDEIIQWVTFKLDEEIYGVRPVEEDRHGAVEDALGEARERDERLDAVGETDLLHHVDEGADRGREAPARDRHQLHVARESFPDPRA